MADPQNVSPFVHGRSLSSLAFSDVYVVIPGLEPFALGLLS